MILVICIDDHNGMMFHKRRQSQDRLLRADMLRQCTGKKLYMDAYSYTLFQRDAEKASSFENDFSAKDGKKETVPAEIIVAEDCFLQAREQDFCFLETMEPFLAAAEAPSLLGHVEGILLYRWNRSYPADTYFTLDLADGSWTLTGQEEFAGSSHERITRETYQKTKGS